MASNEAPLMSSSSSSPVTQYYSPQSLAPYHVEPIAPTSSVEMSHLKPSDPSMAASSPTTSSILVQSGPYIPEMLSAESHSQSHPQLASAPTIASPLSSPFPPGAAIPISEPTTSQALRERPQNSRIESMGIGPSFDGAIMTPAQNQAEPAVLITLLLITGARHPYNIDQKYLRKRNVAAATEDIDPFSISVYTMKELIWRDWREEWDPRPSSPSSIRLIHFGKLLEDKQSLRDCRFQSNAPNVVHMTVKPQELVEDEDNSKMGKALSARRRRSSEAQDTGCRCCIVQ